MQLDQLLLAPAERADVIVDFTGIPDGHRAVPHQRGPGRAVRRRRHPATDFPAADPATTGQVMKFVVVPAGRARTPASRRTSSGCPRSRRLGVGERTRRLSLNEADSSSSPGVGTRSQACSGRSTRPAQPVPLDWGDPVTENPALNATEIWELHNFTEDAHPIHIHEVQFQVVDRQPFDGGGPIRRSAGRRGFKDTVIAYPGEITRVKARFDHPGRFVWHCHIVEHEDNEMMRPLPNRRQRARRTTDRSATRLAAAPAPHRRLRTGPAAGRARHRIPPPVERTPRYGTQST